MIAEGADSRAAGPPPGGTPPVVAPLARLVLVGFVLAPAALIAAAVSLRTGRVVESYRAVMDRVLRFEADAQSAAKTEDVDLPLLLAVATAESAGRADARSRAGAVGLMQLEPGTADEMAQEIGLSHPDLLDPAVSLRLGARYLHRQMTRFEASPVMHELAIAAYNAGPERVQAWLDAGPPPEDGVIEWIRFDETRAFVRRVLDHEARWRTELASRGSVH